MTDRHLSHEGGDMNTLTLLDRAIGAEGMILARLDAARDAVAERLEIQQDRNTAHAMGLAANRAVNDRRAELEAAVGAVAEARARRRVVVADASASAAWAAHDALWARLVNDAPEASTHLAGLRETLAGLAGGEEVRP